MRGTLEQTIAASGDTPLLTASSTYIGWTGIPMQHVEGNYALPVGWAIINGNLVLVSNDPETDTETALDYSIYDNGIIYSFSTAYQSYYPPTNTFITVNTANLRTLQTMVQNFAESLPPGTSQ
jgi:hypothetical protein